jgi:hypothetical protein
VNQNKAAFATHPKLLLINFFQKLQWRITKSFKEWHIKLTIKKCKVDSPSIAILDENLWIVTQEDIWSF